jgi:MerR family transcriptional regulator/heat shock protein HspR
MKEKKEKKPLYMISVVAEMFSIHPQTLRAYERQGLIKPARTVGNTRLYSQEDVDRIELITRLTRDLGVNLAGVEVVLHMREKMEEMRRQMENTIRLLREQLKSEIDSLNIDQEHEGSLVPVGKRGLRRRGEGQG